jgi:hypothetical protein
LAFYLSPFFIIFAIYIIPPEAVNALILGAIVLVCVLILLAEVMHTIRGCMIVRVILFDKMNTGSAVSVWLYILNLAHLS